MTTNKYISTYTNHLNEAKLLGFTPKEFGQRVGISLAVTGVVLLIRTLLSKLKGDEQKIKDLKAKLVYIDPEKKSKRDAIKAKIAELELKILKNKERLDTAKKNLAKEKAKHKS